LHSLNFQACSLLGDNLGRGIALFHLASVHRCRGELDRAIAACDESRVVFRALGDRQWCANALNSLGFMLRDRGAFARGRVALEEALSLYRALGGTRRIAIALLNLGDLARGENDLPRAETLLCQSLDLFLQLQDAWCSSVALENLALVCVVRDQMERACVLFGAAEAQRCLAGAVLPPVDQPEHDRALARITLRLGHTRMADSFARGRGLSCSDALEFVRLRGEHAVAVLPVRSLLTEREREVAALVAGGLTNRQIADELVISKQTADKHIANILSKLGVATRSQVAVWWVSHPAATAA
jgi:non-specific serine/threonine protein kinase